MTGKEGAPSLQSPLICLAKTGRCLHIFKYESLTVFSSAHIIKSTVEHLFIYLQIKKSPCCFEKANNQGGQA